MLLDLFTHWIKAQPASRHISPELKITFSQSRNFLKSKQLGYGIDRCLYKLNPGLPCQSPLISSECVISIEDLLPALDNVAANIESKLVPIDRHIAAFIATRFEEDIQPHLRALASTKQQTSMVGMMSLLAFMQYKLHPEPLLGLVGWVGGGIVSYANADIAVPWQAYFSSLSRVVDNWAVLNGLTKSFVFALVIGIVSCHQGLNTIGGPRGIGRSVTKAVVNSIVLILIVDYFLTRLLLQLDF